MAGEIENKFTNRLINETSPYLLQHAHNPVDWYPWGEEAFARARAENLPIHLSIGYSACHWCHVLAHESFEDEVTAELLNANFVNVKVDREERPDLDVIYMSAIQMMTGSGGWPMTIFLTPDGKPFYGGTYFPPVDRHGLPSFRRILTAIADAYQTRRDEVDESAAGILHELKRLDTMPRQEGELSHELLDQTTRTLLSSLDPVYGGFSNKPKFPPSMALSFLLREHERTANIAARSAVELTLQMMAKGGMYDQLGGGFHRYSVDEKWLVPHFEKMLYDNALLSRIYLDAWLVTGDEFYQRIAVETLDYIRREMTDACGGFYSSQDADSEGVEGKFFIWSREEVDALLGEEDARLFCRYFDITSIGNFEGENILHIDQEAAVIAKFLGVTQQRIEEAIERGKRILFEAREKRIKPHRDEKMLTAWNALMLRSFAEAARVLDHQEYLQVAVSNAEFLLGHLKQGGRLLRTHKGGNSKLNAYLEDYAYLIDGLLSLYEATFDLRWFEEARALAETMIEQFWDDKGGGFFFTSEDHETLITRTRDLYDNATPAGNSVAAHVLLRLSLFTGEESYRKKAEIILKQMKPAMVRAPGAFGHLLCALDLFLASPHEIALIGHSKALTDTVFKRYIPNKVVALATPDDVESPRKIKLLENRSQIGGIATVYVCRNFYCEAPLTDPLKLAARLGIKREL
ncbi:MAG: thioredoxin domain-containing protein [Acidobacteria bacterium]|nr:thioredoxin domain-containing protein [Acidobacteriota bacterium]